MSKSGDYRSKLCQEISLLLGSDFKYYKSNHEFRRARNNGYDVILVSGSNHYSPDINIHLYYGRKFNGVREIERKLGQSVSPYQIHANSSNWLSGEGAWEVNIEMPTPNLAKKIHRAIEKITFPFFDEYSDITHARNTLASDNPWFRSNGPNFHSLLKLDVVLNDLQHFEEWSACMDEFYVAQAKECLLMLGITQTK